MARTGSRIVGDPNSVEFLKFGDTIFPADPVSDNFGSSPALLGSKSSVDFSKELSSITMRKTLRASLPFVKKEKKY